MLMIRFQRVGRKNDPAFRVVLCERTAKPKTSGIEALGSYHPKTKAIVLKNERILYWMSKGAQVSPSVHNLLVKKGVMKGKKIAVAKIAGVKDAAAPAAA
ncbi:MAG: 30S ribosomal protein S16 [Candidatus Sungiibacteriota bacterium]